MCTCVILRLLRLAANMFMNNILIIAKMRLNLINSKIEIYPAEGPMLKAPVAPVPLTVSCSKSWTTVGAGRYTQCSPSNVHREINDPRKKKKTSTVTRKKRPVAKTLLKTWSPTHPSGCHRCRWRFRRPALPTLRVRRWLGRGNLEGNATVRSEKH